VHEFSGSNRTCARALSAHNARRRQRYTTTSAAAAATKKNIQPRADAAHRDEEEEDDDAWRQLLRGNERGTNASGSGTDAEPSGAHGEDDGGGDSADELPRAPRLSAGDGSFLSFLDDILPLQPNTDALSPRPPALLPPLHERYAYFAPAVHSERVSLKLLGDAPLALPHSGLRPAALCAFGDAQPLALHGCVQPGCVLLHMDAVVVTTTHRDLEAARTHADVRTRLAAMLAQPDEAGAFLRAPGRRLRLTDVHGRVATAVGGIVLHTDDHEHDATEPRPVLQDTINTASAALSPPPPPAPLHLSPLAALCTAPARVSLLQCGAGDATKLSACAVTLQVALHGQFVRLETIDGASAAAAPLQFGPCAVLPATGVEGAALCFPADVTTLEPLATHAPAVLLLTRDADIVAEVADTEAALRDGLLPPAARPAVQAALLALGHALRPDCPPALAAHAAAAALEHGWCAAAAHVLYAHAHHDAAALLLPGGVTLLHVAASTGEEWAVRLVLDAGGAHAAYGTPYSRCASAAGATPLHAAAAAGSAAAAAALTEQCCRGPINWCYTRCGGARRTPSELARASGVDALLALDAALYARMHGGAWHPSQAAAVPSHSASAATQASTDLTLAHGRALKVDVAARCMPRDSVPVTNMHCAHGAEDVAAERLTIRETAQLLVAVTRAGDASCVDTQPAGASSCGSSGSSMTTAHDGGDGATDFTLLTQRHFWSSCLPASLALLALLLRPSHRALCLRHNTPRLAARGAAVPVLLALRCTLFVCCAGNFIRPAGCYLIGTSALDDGGCLRQAAVNTVATGAAMACIVSVDERHT
jgi:hypothetical protein